MKHRRVAIWFESLLGYGHALRALSLAAALGDRGVLLISGSVAGNAFLEGQLGRSVLISLPPVRLATPTGDLIFPTTSSTKSVLRERVETGWNALRAFRPHVLVFEHFPFGRWGFSDELVELLARTREQFPSCRCLVSVRDIPQGDERPARYGGVVQSVLDRAFDGIVAHGLRELVDIVTLIPELQQLRIPLTYTGYLGRHDWPDYDPQGPLVVDLGGGWNGEPLCQSMAEALRGLKVRRAVVVTGRRDLDAGATKLHSRSPTGIDVELVIDRFKRGTSAGTCSCYVTRGGYNAAVGVMASKVPTVMIPHGFSGEQKLRAERLHRAERVATLSEQELLRHPGLLGARLEEAGLCAARWQPVPVSVEGVRRALLS